MTIQSSGSWLHIVNAQIANHQGTYTCLVQNSVGKARRQFNVNILGKYFSGKNNFYLNYII